MKRAMPSHLEMVVDPEEVLVHGLTHWPKRCCSCAFAGFVSCSQPNPYTQKPDFVALAAKYPDLTEYVTVKNGIGYIDFKVVECHMYNLKLMLGS